MNNSVYNVLIYILFSYICIKSKSGLFNVWIYVLTYGYVLILIYRSHKMLIGLINNIH